MKSAKAIISGHAKRIKDWIYHKKARRAAKRYDLDFEHKCCFYHQVANIGDNIRHNWITYVPMKSGKIALYKVIEDVSPYHGTGQADWKFEFQGYKDDKTNKN